MKAWTMKIYLRDVEAWRRQSGVELTAKTYSLVVAGAEDE
jgi:hypothetical protein